MSDTFYYDFIPQYNSGMQNWKSISSSPNGAILVAASENTSDGKIHVSLDYGSTWSTKDSAGVRSWLSVSSANNGRYIAAATSGYIYISFDYGNTWTENTSCGWSNWESIDYSENSSVIVALGNDIVMCSRDAISFSNTGLPALFYTDVCVSDDGNKIIVVALTAIYISLNRGVSWTTSLTSIPECRCVGSSSDGDIAYCSSYSFDNVNSTIYKTTDAGLNWSPVFDSPPFGVVENIRCSSDGSIVLAKPYDTNVAYSSDDGGASWEMTGYPFPTSSFTGMDLSKDGQKACLASTTSAYIYTGNAIVDEFSSSSSSLSSLSSLSLPSSSSFSSSSSSYVLTQELYAPILSQNHSNLIPFSFIVESGFVDDSILSFSIDMKNTIDTNTNSIISSILLNRDSPEQTIDTTYIPESEDAKYRHEPIMYVDVIAKDQSGISKVSARSQKQNYGYEDPKWTYNTPKFSWNNEIVGEQLSSESSIDNTGIVWLGTQNKSINQVFYNMEYAVNVYSSNVTSEVYGLLFNSYNSNLNVSGYDHLSLNVVNDYYGSNTEFNKFIEIANTNDDIFSYVSNDGKIISTQSYLGKVIVREQNTLEIVSEYSGFDAPFKVVRSPYHNCYLVAGTNTLWKLFDDGTKEAIYSISGYKISDFDCSENGYVCILFNNDIGGILRVISNNLYSIITETRVSSFFFRFCRYCGKGLFYAISELNVQNNKNYIAKNYVVDINKKSILETDIASNAVTTTLTTTFAKPTNKVEIKSPIGGESWVNGTSHEIKWVSTEAINSQVSIELYKGSKINDIISYGNNNSGIYNWLISNTYPESSDYKIKINWLAPGDTSNFSQSGNFSIVANAVTEETTTLPIIQDKCIGITFSEYNNCVVLSLRNGLIGVYDIGANDFYGLFDCGVRNVICIASNDNRPRKPKPNTKIRVFVGSQQYLSDKWDSGVIETELNSIYYGGGNNLVSGEQYYVNLQVYNDKYGWSEIQTRQFKMPN